VGFERELAHAFDVPATARRQGRLRQALAAGVALVLGLDA
jgi:hypothetical protein